MDFLRRHAFYLGCGLACIAGVVLGVTGLRAMPDVERELENVAGLYGKLQSLAAQPVNLDRIEAEEARIALLVTDRDKVIDKGWDLYPNVVEKIVEGGNTSYSYHTLVPDVFPDGAPKVRFAFRAEYETAMTRLLVSLKSGAPPSYADIAVWTDRIADEHAADKEALLDRGAPEAPAAPSGPLRTPAGMLTVSGAREDARARASIAAAQGIYCYAVPHTERPSPAKVPSLHFLPEMIAGDTGDAPPMEDVWLAQISYWVQQHVVDAIAAVNNEAAEQARGDQGAPWVGIMPVKEVISIRVAPDYVPTQGEPFATALPGGYGEAAPPGTAESYFTGTASGPSYEVVQYTVKLVMDQRDIPLLVDRICSNSLHTLLRIAYEVVPPNRDLDGKIYGAEPTVNVVMDFEVIMLGTVFRKVMPQEICDYYEIPCPAPEGADEEGD